MVKAARIGNYALVSAGLLLFGLSLIVQFLGGDFGDKQWELLYAHMWLSGDRLYIDIFPVSPPLIFWLYSLPVRLADRLGFISDGRMLVVLGLLVTASSIFLSTRLIARHTAFQGDKKKLLECAALLAFVSILRTSPMYFLDREHLFLVLIFPYLLCAMPSLADKTFPLRIKVAAGLLAGIGFCLKPHCLVVLAGIMFMDLLMRRTWRGLVRLENLIICALGLFYLLSVLLATPEYFSTVMPIAMATYSSTRDESPILFYALNAVFTLLPLMLLFRPRYHSPYRSDIYYLAGLLPFFFFYALLNNNWAYTYYPLTSMALFLAGFMLWEFMYLAKTFHSRAFPTWRLWLAQGIGVACFVFLQDIFQHYIYELVFLFALFAFWEWSYLRRNDRERSLPQWTFWAGAYVCILSFSLKALISFNYFLSVFEDGCTNNARCYHDDVFVAEVQGRQGPLTFGSLSVEFARWTRLSLYSGAKWETRFPQLWMLPKFLASDAAFAREHQWILDYVAESLAQDMDIRKPEVMFVDDTNIVYGKYAPIDMVPYFSFNAHFREAWRHYRFLHRIDLCAVPGNPHPKYKQVCSYDVYRRTE